MTLYNSEVIIPSAENKGLAPGADVKRELLQWPNQVKMGQQV